MITMMQTAKPWRRCDSAACISDCRGFTARRSLLVQAKVRSILVIIADVLIHEAFQMTLIRNDHMDQIPAATPDPALRHTVLPRTSETGPLRLNAKDLHRVAHLLVKIRAAVKDQIAGRRVVRERLAHLLNNPNTARVPGHIEMKNAPPVMGNDEEAVKNTKGQ